MIVNCEYLNFAVIYLKVIRTLENKTIYDEEDTKEIKEMYFSTYCIYCTKYCTYVLF